ncbi:hypothetical protein BJY24_001624 [Nocardia transvalensis]|uniref:Intracellular septation protein A n=1 Tax=Nocardia transvalensis TaxID=37333 RepID=A0A7W9PAX5_9NOCA|nr:VC0807 family protein [Nocardia transvalensis]MBB5912757.1 hypothetical protein [Nocardia transvalensis]
MSTASADVSAANLRRRLAVQFGVDVLAPLVAFYVLRGAGVSVLTACLLAGAIPAVRTLLSLARSRRPDVVALVTVSLFVAGAAVSVLQGDPRVVFAKDGWLTGLLGVWVIASLGLRRPFMLHLGTMIATARKGEEAAQGWERRWGAEPRFRRDLRLVSWVIGVVLVLDAVVRVILAYTVPLDLLPLVTNAQYVAMLVGLLGWFFPYTARRGLRV